MKKIISTLVLVLCVTGSSFAFDVEDAIEARQAVMKVYSFNIGIVADMAQGKSEYDAEQAEIAANNLAAMTHLNNGAMWPEGSSNADDGLADKTAALPEAWTTFPEVLDKQKEAAKAMQAFPELAGKGLDSLRVGLKDVGSGCKGCHKKFRAEDDE